MAVAHRISVSFGEEEFMLLERISSHYQRSKAEVARRIISQFLEENPEEFRVETSLRRKKHMLVDENERLRHVLAELKGAERCLEKDEPEAALKSVRGVIAILQSEVTF